MKALYKSPMDSAVIIVHAGAWAIPDTQLEATRRGIKAAARKGYDVLRAGGSALDAVQTAVMTMEDNPAFNAGRGSTLNCNGEVEMDALIMDGRHLAAGSVACVRNVAHPIALARLVMDKTDHTLLVDRGANEFGREMDVPLLSSRHLVTAEAETELQQFIRNGYDNAVDELFTPKIADVGLHKEIPEEESKERHDHETVGTVALDSYGNVACATSTGGIPTKKPGRVGDSPIVGRGSTPNCNGEVEMDALIMDGRHLAVGSVACVRSIANPIALARLVMDKTDHTLLVDRGANEFGREMDVPLVTAEAETELQQFIKKAYDNSVSELFTPKIADVHQEIPDEESKERHDHETVGAVALDSHGNVACATSTGGIPTKKPGRVGDSPIVGAGGYADNDVGAVSSTGHGESITRVCLAQRVISHMQSGSSAREAAKKALTFMSHRIQGFGGVIVVGRTGDIAHVFTTPRMAWASIGGADGLLRHGINPDEDICEHIEQL